MESTTGLTVREIFSATYATLADKYSPTELELPRRPAALIADDSNGNRIRQGFMRYKGIGFFNIDGKAWAIGVGDAWGAYPADPFDSDIITLPFSQEGMSDEEARVEIEKRIRLSPGFANSPIYGLRNGSICTPSNSKIGAQMAKQIGRIDDFVAQTPAHDSKYIEIATRKPACTRPARYKPGFEDVIAQALEKILAEDNGENFAESRICYW